MKMTLQQSDRYKNALNHFDEERKNNKGNLENGK